MIKKTDKVNLSVENKIDLSKNAKKKANEQKEKSEKWATLIRVPESDQHLLLTMDVKLTELKLKKISHQDKWHIGLMLFDKLMDYVEPSELNKNTNILKYLELLIDEKFND